MQTCFGTSLLAEWLRLRAPNAGHSGSVPGQGTTAQMLQLRVYVLQLKIPHLTIQVAPAQTNK